MLSFFNAETKIPNRDAMPTPLPPLINNSTKILRVEDQTAPLPRVDPEEEYGNREKKLPSPIQIAPLSAATREKYTKKKGN